MAGFYRLSFLFLLLCLSACGSQQSSLVYAPSAPIQEPKGPAVVAMGAAIDQREDRSDWLGTIRGGFGNPLKTLHSDRPVPQVVATAFSDGLAARGLLAPVDKQQFDLKVTILEFECNQYVRRDAHADFRVTLLQHESGRQIYSNEVKVDKLSGSLMALDVGVFSSLNDLRDLILKTLDQAVDEALDNPEFRAALAR